MLRIGSFLSDSNQPSDHSDDEPVRGELLSVEKLEDLARKLGASHKVSIVPEHGRDLLGRLEDNRRNLEEACSILADATSGERSASPAAEWLVDNFHVVQEQLRAIREDLPRDYYWELPKLAQGELAGFPRVYAVAVELIAHTDSRVDGETLKRFVRAYQESVVLSTGELWAMAVSLRLALVENLRRLAARAVANRRERMRADELANRLLQLASRRPDEVIQFLDNQAGKTALAGGAFIVELSQRLHDQDVPVAPALEWLERHLSEEGKAISQVVHAEHQKQAENQITVANIITSMRALSALDWEDLFESVSLLEPILREDPAGAYAGMDFKTRDRYRHEIERINKRVNRRELEVARHAISLADNAAQGSPNDKVRHHVGYYLIDAGVGELEKLCGYRPGLGERVSRAILGHPSKFYFVTLALLTAVLAGVPIYYALPPGSALVVYAMVLAVSLIPASEMALSILNWLITTIFKPRALPRMDTSTGIPETATTMVVVPTILADQEAVQELLEKIEVLHLANEDVNLYFALLSDFADFSSETKSDDAALLEAARQGIARLNARYPDEGRPPRFHLFHRRRLWNPSEGKWIGWERKRGKLRELNRLLRGDGNTSFSVATAQPNLLDRVRYVITLDTDTRLPRTTARRLVGTILHPLNQPKVDAGLGRVVRGYGILQPRVGISLTSASQSRFALAFSGSTGIDPYTTAVSDVYQDLFGEGSYTGKGLYDVAAFEAALGLRVPENTLLSHDLLEGLFARTALVTDIEVLDDYPSQYDAYATRLHRWIRGDWQVARWLMPRVRDSRGHKTRNRLPLISIWKLVDNLRRSLVAPSLLLWLLAGWTVLPGSALFWTLLAVLMMVFPVYAEATTTMLRWRRGVRWKVHLEVVWGNLGINAGRATLTVVFLAHRALLPLDAISRTLWRMLISHRRLLEWVTAAQARDNSAISHRAFWRSMLGAPAAAGLVTILVLFVQPGSLIIAGPFLVLWFMSPSIAYWTSSPPRPRPTPLKREDINRFRLLARRTWRYFETFVGESNHWLPPDNFQESPTPALARRTSPTNVGLLLLATTAARDFGYTATLEMIERLELTFATFERLPRYRGHFFNWYDIHLLEPLTPEYVSTVDSGNLAGHLIAVKQACLEIRQQPLFDMRCIDGLADTAVFLRQEADRIRSIPERIPGLRISQLLREVGAVHALLKGDPPLTLGGWAALFESLFSRLQIVEDMTNALVDEHGEEALVELRFWASALLHQADSYRRDLRSLTPWAGGATERLIALAGGFGEPMAENLDRFKKASDPIPAPAHMAEQCDRLLLELRALRDGLERSTPPAPDRDLFLAESRGLESAIERARQTAVNLLTRTSMIARLIDRFVEEMDFTFLFDEKHHVLTIGFNATEGKRDDSFYDLLASEARLGSFVAIATGDVPTDHWFRLGRQLAAVDGRRVLISWTASMFEYLMPLLVMRSYEGTLLDETCRSVVDRQIEYGRERGVPWGVSESAYNARDLQFNYRYGPFGIPGMGLKRGLSEDLVVAPYATLLAAMIRPRAAVDNLKRLEREGAVGRYGLYEAIDYTPERLPHNESRVVIDAFMTHHQGMNLVALDNVLNDRIVQRRFHSEPIVQATELLLQERLPRGVSVFHPRAEEVKANSELRKISGPAARRYRLEDVSSPRPHLLSNGTYSVMVTAAGSGFSTCNGVSINRWREDATRDNWGLFFYVRDIRSGAVWSAGFQPSLRSPQSYEVSFSEDKAEISREDVGLVTRTEVVVSPEDNAEVRRVSISNHSTRTREIELTSYSEVVLSSPESDVGHKAFNNLFVETEVIGAGDALLARRRPRSENESPIWCAHVMAVEGETVGPVQYETDRARFIGRGRTTADPMAVIEDRPLSNTVGPVLDPIFSLRRRLIVAPNETVRVCFTIGVARSREEAVALAAKYREPGTFDREATLAWTSSRVELRHMKIEPDDAHLFQRLAGRVLYHDASLRAPGWILEQNRKSLSGLWPHGISGDLPIVLVRIADARGLDFVARLFAAYGYWRLKRFEVDLVILNEHSASYLQMLQDDILALARKSGLQQSLEKRGGVHLLRADVMPAEDRILLETVARVSLAADRGSLESQLTRRAIEPELPATLIPRWPRRTYPEPDHADRDLDFFNGLGGFSPGGNEYIITLGDKQWTPAPWVNVISNPADFGFVVSESGGTCSWFLNSRENRLTPWSNDAVSDSPGEVVYIRDEDSGSCWTPTPLPIRETAPYTIRHGQGYTVFEHTSHGINQQLEQFVPIDASVKVSVLRLTNTTDRPRRLSVTTYYELVLGVQKEQSAPFIITEIDKESGAVIARNHYSSDFGSLLAFAAVSGERCTVTADRREFLGPGRSLNRPAAMDRTGLSGRTGAGLDPCIAIQTLVELAPHQTAAKILLLGQAKSLEEVRATVSRFSDVENADAALDLIKDYWQDVLGAIHVHTPDPALDLLMNRWLLYQILSCRIYARSGFYQSGGAYGFRDQLQDVMALVYAKPDVAREHILRAAGRQFKEGDVQHWWHPPYGRGLRTRVSDDAIWLPYVSSFYVDVTGDLSILDEEVPFIEGSALAGDEKEAYAQPLRSTETATLFEHCVRALERSLATGGHGLPLIGTGDWNDGMDRIGPGGRGESIWLGWFLFTALKSFQRLSDQRGQNEQGAHFRRHADRLRDALEEQGWDGGWYRRAYFDDGTPLGSSQNAECRIDSISQSWAVISEAADRQRAALAMTSVDEQLVRRGDGIVLLLTPPFNESPLEPGYIKAYVPGVRENGGQYSHAAMWTLIAFAMLGDGDRAGELLSLLNPIGHASTRAGTHRYRVEPYVVAGDVYSVAPHVGRGGWTWYTGAAGWMYRAALESVFGFRLHGNHLRIEPCIPRGWRKYEITYRKGTASYQIEVHNPQGVSSGVSEIELDGEPQGVSEIPLLDDGRAHHLRVVLGSSSGEARVLSAAGREVPSDSG